MELISATAAHCTSRLASAPLRQSCSSSVLSAEPPWLMAPNPGTAEPEPVPVPPPSTLIRTTTISPTRPRPPPPTAMPRPPNPPPPPPPRMSVTSDVSRSAPSLNLIWPGFPDRGAGNPASAEVGADGGGDVPCQAGLVLRPGPQQRPAQVGGAARAAQPDRRPGRGGELGAGRRRHLVQRHERVAEFPVGQPAVRGGRHQGAGPAHRGGPPAAARP